MTSTLFSHARACRGGDLELVDAFDAQALAIAAMAEAPNTRRAYATAYRAFAAFLRARYGAASRETITIAAVAAWRDELTAAGLAPSSIAQRVSTVRRLAATLGADLLVQQVRCIHVQHEEPRALSDVELERLLRQPDRRTVIGPETEQSSSSSRARDCAAPSSPTSPSATSGSAVASPTPAGAPRSRPGAPSRRALR